MSLPRNNALLFLLLLERRRNSVLLRGSVMLQVQEEAQEGYKAHEKYGCVAARVGHTTRHTEYWTLDTHYYFCTLDEMCWFLL